MTYADDAGLTKRSASRRRKNRFLRCCTSACNAERKWRVVRVVTIRRAHDRPRLIKPSRRAGRNNSAIKRAAAATSQTTPPRRGSTGSSPGVAIPRPRVPSLGVPQRRAAPASAGRRPRLDRAHKCAYSPWSARNLIRRFAIMLSQPEASCCPAQGPANSFNHLERLDRFEPVHSTVIATLKP